MKTGDQVNKIIIVFCSLLILGPAASGLAFEARMVSPGVETASLGQQTEKDMLFLLVDKNNLRAHLMTWPEEFRRSDTLMSFRIAIGKEEGDKQVEGDNRTPEGIYFAQKIIDGETLPAKYGPFAIPINFPNPYDRHLGKTGYGIWLHGVKEDARVEESKVTEGCVAFYNADIVSLSDWLEPSQSVVVIAKSAAEVNRPRDVATVKERTRQWYRAWSERDHDRYLSFYDESFRSRGMNRDQYGAYKKRVFGLYDEMLVDIFNIRVFTHKSYAVSLFNQNFNGDDRYVSEGRKVLYWERHDDGSWRIVHEVFDSGRFKLQSFSRDYLVRLSEESPSAKHIAKDNVNSSM